MIVVKIEMWPSGNEDKAKEIGRTYISNVGGTATKGDYNVRVCRRGNLSNPLLGNNFTRKGKVENYPRLSYNVWRLIIRALKSAFPEEK